MIFFILSEFSIPTAAGCVTHYNILTDLDLHDHFKTLVLSKTKNQVCYV